MPWKKISSDISEKWTFDEAEHKVLEGELISKTQGATKYKENQWRYVIQDKAGTPWVVWGKSVLDRNMESVKEGDNVRIEYLGIAQSPKTGNKYKNFNVEVWTE